MIPILDLHFGQPMATSGNLEFEFSQTSVVLAKRLSCRKGSIRHPDFQVFTNWIPARNLPE